MFQFLIFLQKNCSNTDFCPNLDWIDEVFVTFEIPNSWEWAPIENWKKCNLEIRILQMMMDLELSENGSAKVSYEDRWSPFPLWKLFSTKCFATSNFFAICAWLVQHLVEDFQFLLPFTTDDDARRRSTTLFVKHADIWELQVIWKRQ